MKNKKVFAILTLVCFMLTFLVPVSAFAADDVTNTIVADSSSVVYTNDSDIDVQGNAQFNLSIRNVIGELFTDTTTTLYVWVTKENSTVPVNTVEVGSVAGDTFTALESVGATTVFTVSRATSGTNQFAVKFYSAGTYQIHVSAIEPEVVSGRISAVSEFNAQSALVTVNTKDPTLENLRLSVTMPNEFSAYKDAADNAAGTKTSATDNGDGTYTAALGDGGVASALSIEANNVDEKKITVELSQFIPATGKTSIMSGKTLKISSTGAIEVSRDSVTTNALGRATFSVSGNAAGTYKVYVTYGQFEVVIEVNVGATGANSIECTDEPTNPIDVLNENLVNGLGSYVEFTMYDVNGNELNAENTTAGWDKAKNSTKSNYNGDDVTGYVAIVSQPADSKLTNKDLWFNGTTICSNKQISVEGTYTFKVVLNNGNYALATIEVKAFQTPVQLVVTYPEAIELGSTVGFSDLYWLDANNVQKDASNGDRGVKVSLAATGYAVSNFDSTTGNLTAKTDEKYIGQEITVTAVDERHNLIASATVTVADDAKDLQFATKTAEVNVNNKIRVNIVDSQGKRVTLGNAANAQSTSVEISYVILDKPADARVFVSTADNKVKSDGYFDMNLTSNTVGNVAVQAIVKYSYKDAITQDNVVKYYTGSQIFAVGNGSTGTVVVMSIGSNEIVINDTKATIDAAPIVQNSRTYVPYRALAEAFGAEVAWDEATQSVTAELNGVTVVMTIGSATYTVNGTEATMDVAPFISGSRTMVPVRFVAEAFGIKVIPTYDENGATADILFNL